MAKYTKEEILKIAKEENVKYIRLAFTDIHGVINRITSYNVCYTKLLR